jgi:prepilin-type N-terminal cleavage/methylation domain-containing protein
VKNRVKVIVNKKGFTLAEIIVVIALIGILLLFVMPNLVDIFSNSVKSTMKVQEKEIEDAALIYLEDYCKNKIGNNICPGTIKKGSNKKYSGYIKLETLVNSDYIEDVSLQGNDCKGCVIFTDNKAEAYLVCAGDSYETDTNVNFKNTCNLN